MKEVDSFPIAGFHISGTYASSTKNYFIWFVRLHNIYVHFQYL